jgi:ribosomal protein L37AE/L43A
MPVYHFKCPNCGFADRKILTPEAVRVINFHCKKCATKMERNAQPPTTQITETLDNGVMVRKLERLADAEQIFHERAHGKKGNI